MSEREGRTGEEGGEEEGSEEDEEEGTEPAVPLEEARGNWKRDQRSK